MNRGLPWKAGLIFALIAASFWLIYPPFDVKDKDGKVIQEGKIKLGLDLKGGMHLLLKVDTATCRRTRVKTPATGRSRS
ncbi:MAG: hypothetical protein WC317_06870 [Candidatus Omnitrophota bacterium]|jgi:preprotein translocase subunit SecD